MILWEHISVHSNHQFKEGDKHDSHFWMGGALMLYFKNIIWIIWDGRSCYSQLGKYNLPHYVCLYTHLMGFPGSSTSKQSTFNTGDPASIPGVGRSPGEGIGYPLQGSWASLMAQMVNNLPAMQETWVRSLGWEYPLEEGMATHSIILAWRIPWTEEPGGLQSVGSQRVGHD